MALTGGRIKANVYAFGRDKQEYKTARAFAFSPYNTRYYSIPALDPDVYTTSAGVVMNSVIEVLPTGVRNYIEKYWTDSTVAQIEANSL